MRACSRYLILTKLSPCTLLFGTARLLIFLGFEGFCQIFRPNPTKNRFIFWLLLFIWLMDQIKSLLLWINLPIFTLHSFKYFELNSTLDVFSGLHAFLTFVKIPPCMLIRACTLIRDTRVLYFLDFQNLNSNSNIVISRKSCKSFSFNDFTFLLTPFKFKLAS